MTPAEFRIARKRLGLTQQALAIRLGYTGSPANLRITISRYERGTRPIPPMVALFVELLETGTDYSQWGSPPE